MRTLLDRRRPAYAQRERGVREGVRSVGQVDAELRHSRVSFVRPNVNSTTLSVPCNKGVCRITWDDTPVGCRLDRMRHCVSRAKNPEGKTARFYWLLLPPRRADHQAFMISLLILSRNRKFASGMHHIHDLNAGSCHPIENGVVRVGNKSSSHCSQIYQIQPSRSTVRTGHQLLNQYTSSTKGSTTISAGAR